MGRTKAKYLLVETSFAQDARIWDLAKEYGPIIWAIWLHLGLLMMENADRKTGHFECSLDLLLHRLGGLSYQHRPRVARLLLVLSSSLPSLEGLRYIPSKEGGRTGGRVELNAAKFLQHIKAKRQEKDEKEQDTEIYSGVTRLDQTRPDLYIRDQSSNNDTLSDGRNSDQSNGGGSGPFKQALERIGNEPADNPPISNPQGFAPEDLNQVWQLFRVAFPQHSVKAEEVLAVMKAAKGGLGFVHEAFERGAWPESVENPVGLVIQRVKERMGT